MYAYIDFKDLIVTIELTQNPYTTHLQSKLSATDSYDFRTFSRPIVIPIDEEKIDHCWNILRNNYYKLCSILNQSPRLDLPTSFPMENFYLNILHRYFTSALTFKTWDNNSFEMTDEIYNLINGLNDNVHTLETFITNDKMSPYLDNPIKWLEIEKENCTMKDIFPVEDYSEYISQDYNVYAIKHITGKDFITAYFDNDTSNAWDVQNCHITCVGFCIDVFGDLKRIWQSQDFKNWLSENNYTGSVGYFPVGNISNQDLSYLQNNYYNLEVQSVNLSN